MRCSEHLPWFPCVCDSPRPLEALTSLFAGHAQPGASGTQTGQLVPPPCDFVPCVVEPRAHCGLRGRLARPGSAGKLRLA